jgi:hypothetical protein
MARDEPKNVLMRGEIESPHPVVSHVSFSDP